jgi:hypothetical protein
MLDCMGLTPRDVSVVRFVDLFGQATATQIRTVVFGGVHETSFYDSIERLRKNNYVTRLGRYSMSDTGGSPPYVYSLGRRGRELIGEGARLTRKVLAHPLDVCQAYVDFVRAEQMGELKILQYAVEQPVTEGTRSDLFIEVGVKRDDGKNLKLSYYIEIDEDTMGHARIVKKLRGYTSAGHNAHVVFGVIDEPRARTIQRYIKNNGYDQDIFHACQFRSVVGVCLSLFEV